MRVAAICPVYNTAAADLHAAVSSVLNQSGGGVAEIWLVDDCSASPATLAALRDLAVVPGVKVIQAERNSGPAAARNLGLEAATAEWIGFIDSDDLWPADKLEHARRILEPQPGVQWIIGETATLNIDGQIEEQSALTALDEGRARRPALTRSIILDGLHLGSCLIRRDAIGHQRFKTEIYYGEDILFLAKLSLTVCAHRAPGVGYISRRQRQSLMWSAARLTDRFASGPLAGYRDPDLRAFRREYRWALYAVYKDIAVNNLINQRRLRALRSALRALLLDPREVGEFARFVRSLPCRDRQTLSEAARKYAPCEQVLLKRDGTLDRVS